MHLESPAKRHFFLLSCLILGILLFSLTFPGLFNENGIPILSFVALSPIFFVIKYINYKESIFYGFFYGTCNYLLFNYWLASFDPVSFSVAPTIIGIYHIFLFLFIRYIYNNFKSMAYIPLTLSWLLYEVFKGENLIGYTYGTLAHSMYKTHIFTGIVDITGTYFLSLLLVFPSIFFTVLSGRGFLKRLLKKSNAVALLIYVLILILASLYTHTYKIDLDKTQSLRVSLIQHNLDSWLKGSDDLYKKALDDLIELSSSASLDDPQVIIWSETAFVPAIEWHKKYKKSLFRLNLVNRMENYIKSQKADYVIGANETVGSRIDSPNRYNSIYHYKGDRILNKYRKMKLVPFTESFPYPKLFPLLYQHTINMGAKHYKPGLKQINFNIAGVTTTPLICYEDTFSSIARTGVQNGSELLMNLTNDAWSKEPACSMQHLSAAVFRTIENRRSLVRSGTGGYTCVIDPNGNILKSLPILTKGQLTFDTPIYSGHKTFYTRYGNIIDKILIILLIILIVVKKLSPLSLFNTKG